MARRNNNSLLFIVVIGFLVILGVYCVWGKSNDGYSPTSKKRPPVASRQVGNNGIRENDMEIIVGNDVDDDGSDFKLLHVFDNESLIQNIGIGRGPGLLGTSYRYTADNIG